MDIKTISTAFFIITVAVAGFIAGLMLLNKTQKQELDCSRYKTYSINELPIGCYEYYGVKTGRGDYE